MKPFPAENPHFSLFSRNIAQLRSLSNCKTVSVNRQRYANALLAVEANNIVHLQTIHAQFIRNLAQESQFLAKLTSLRLANLQAIPCLHLVQELLEQVKTQDFWWAEAFLVVAENYKLQGNRQKARIYAKFAHFHFSKLQASERAFQARAIFLLVDESIPLHFSRTKELYSLYRQARKFQQTSIAAQALRRLAKAYLAAGCFRQALRYCQRAIELCLAGDFPIASYCQVMQLRADIYIFLGDRARASRDRAIVAKVQKTLPSLSLEHKFG